MANERARELRKNRTAAERRLWRKLRELKQAGFNFRQQVPIDRYIVDFACLSKRFIVEVDGGTHSTGEEVARDARRERYLRDQGFHILRVWNSEVRENIDGVMDAIVDALGLPPPYRRKGEEKPWRSGRMRRHKAKQNAEGGALGPPPPSPPRKGEGRLPRRGRVRYRDPMLALAHRTAAAVVDPEIPVLTLEDLGLLRGVERRDGRIVVRLPATLAIRQAVELALADAGIVGALVETVLSPPWSSDDITEEGRRKLKEFGIAPPAPVAGVRALFGVERVACPRCGSTATAKVSEFGSTACKALWRCEACGEPFDYFKCL
jgi:ring-1,2-phenylacetyl-CoA epoxidase subunit PaaD